MSSDLIASLIAGATAEIIMIPACTVQTLYFTQTNFTNDKRYGILQTAKKLYSEHGIRGFYKAAFSGAIAQMVSTGSKYTIYKSIQQYRGNNNKDLLNNILNGSLAGILSIPFTQPFDVYKISCQNQDPLKIKDLRNEGIKILYRGATQSGIKSMILIGSLYPINDFYRNYIENPFLAAMATSLSITPIIHPFELAKRRASAGQEWRLGWDPRFYYRGLLCNLFRATPHFAISMLTIDFLKGKLD